MLFLIKKNRIEFIITFFLLFYFFPFNNIVNAGNLTKSQIESIMSLLKSFKVDNKTLVNVEISLKGSNKNDISKTVINQKAPIKIITTPIDKSLIPKNIFSSLPSLNELDNIGTIEDIKNFQMINDLEVTGVIDSHTRRYISRFQNKNKIKVTGYLDKVTLDNLKDISKY